MLLSHQLQLPHRDVEGTPNRLAPPAVRIPVRRKPREISGAECAWDRVPPVWPTLRPDTLVLARSWGRLYPTRCRAVCSAAASGASTRAARPGQQANRHWKECFLTGMRGFSTLWQLRTVCFNILGGTCAFSATVYGPVPRNVKLLLFCCE